MIISSISPLFNHNNVKLDRHPVLQEFSGQALLGQFPWGGGYYLYLAFDTDLPGSCWGVLQ
jgi:hypothetical protein